jgi:hypothetical protein
MPLYNFLTDSVTLLIWQYDEVLKLDPDALWTLKTERKYSVIIPTRFWRP